MKTIKIDISAEGSVTVGVTGVKGKQCRDLTREIEHALGKTTEVKPTTEMLQEPAFLGQSQTAKQGSGGGGSK